MEAHVQKTIDGLRELIGKREAELREAKQTVNNLCVLAGEKPCYDLPGSIPTKTDRPGQNLGGEKTIHNPRPFGKRQKTSRYHGVSFNRATGRYRAEFQVKGKHYYCGEKDSEVEAAEAVDKKLIELGQKPRNFPKA